MSAKGTFWVVGALRSHRGSAVRAIISAILIGAASGCAQTRPARTQDQLLAQRADLDQQMLSDTRAVTAQMIQRAKSQYDEYKAGRRANPPVINVLIISGGGDWGAFGAGFLKGWGRVPKTDPMARPDFDRVTGVSTGALIAPFAFLGDDTSIDKVVMLYRNPKLDWVQKRGWFYFLPTNISLMEVPGLEREVREQFDEDTIKRIEQAGTNGRLLAVSATNIDDGSLRVFELIDEARRARQTGDFERIRNVVLASAGIPGAFPYRIIDGQMYVDGGVTGNIIYGGRIAEEDTLAPQWKKAYPDVPIPTVRYWVIFNNQFRPPPRVVEPNWMDVVTRSLETSTRASTRTAIRHLVDLSSEAELKWHQDVQVRVVSIPGEWSPPSPKPFDKATMNQLADLGERMGADPKTWTVGLP